MYKSGKHKPLKAIQKSGIVNWGDLDHLRPILIHTYTTSKESF